MSCDRSEVELDNLIFGVQAVWSSRLVCTSSDARDVLEDQILVCCLFRASSLANIFRLLRDKRYCSDVALSSLMEI